MQRALRDYDSALQSSPGYRPSHTGRGLAYERMGDRDKARSEFQQAIASTSPLRGDIAKSAIETAQARLAALDSGAPLPVIPPSLGKPNSPNAIPTPTVAIPAPVAANPAQIGRRVALVIGNSVYPGRAPLPNAQRDAEAVSTLLKAVGFQAVRLDLDATREKLVEALRKFAEDAEQADWALVYFAGHGIEMNGTNYLVPTDARLAADRDVQFEAIPLDQVLAAVEGARKLRLVLLDACRENPFVPQMRRTPAPAPVAAAAESSTAGATIATRTIGRGLSRVDVRSNGATLVVYAAKHGQLALDGEGRNSPFVTALIQRLATPGVELNKLFRLVRDDVMEATAGRQEPYTYGSLPGREEYFFVERR